MTAHNHRLAEKINLVETLNGVYGHFNNPKVHNESKEDGTAFKQDFPRTGEIELIINGKSLVQHKISDSEVDKTNNQNHFIELLTKQRPELACVIMTELNQAGVLYAGRLTMERYFLARVGIYAGNIHHHITIDVANQDEVIVTETILYKSLRVGPADCACDVIISNNTLEADRFVSEEEQKNLGNYRNSPKVQAKLRPDDYGTQELVFPKRQPLSLTVRYILRYCEKTGTYEMKVPSKDDITLTVPMDLAKRLAFNIKWTIGDNISEFISRLVDVVKKLVIGKVSEHVVTEQCKQDQAEPSYYMNRPRP